MRGDESVKVSVVVAVYNPGANMDDLINSLLAQSLPDDEYEVIFADDASTDGTSERLDALAAEHGVVSVIHNSPNSGWPGKPRNLGIDAARGEYVYFVDNDDWLEPEALERMYDYAKANDSDIVWGRIVGDNRAVPRDTFRKNVPDAKLGKAPLLTLLTPHKLFRTSMLRTKDIRFPEGRRRLEDHVFVMKAYFAAKKISILADYPCYHWVNRGTNASFDRFDPAMYFGNVREVLDVVEANTEPGAFRDKLLAHWYGGKSIAWLEGKAMIAYPDDYRRELFDTIRQLALDRFAPALDAYLAPRRRIASQLLRAGDRDGMLRLAEWQSGVRNDAVVEALAWEGDCLRATVSCTLRDGSGRPVTVRRADDKVLLVLPPELEIGDPGSDALDVTASFGRSRIDPLLRDRNTWVVEFGQVEKLAPPEVGADGTAPLRASCDIVVDPAVLVTHAIVDLVARFVTSGWGLEGRPHVDSALLTDAARRNGGRPFTPYGTRGHGGLSLRRSTPQRASAAAASGVSPQASTPSTRSGIAERLRRKIARKLS